MLKKAQETIKKFGLIKNHDKILIGVSGGPDSVALLYFLFSLKNEFRLKLYLAHVDHMLRKDSAKDAVFVRKLAEKLNLEIFSVKIDVSACAQTGSIEEVARTLRQKFLFATAKKLKADKIAVGHNFDDQAETVLMRIIRGSGLYGLAGILPKRKVNGFMIIRPLLEVRRSQIERYLRNIKVKACLDESNKSDLYFRNKIRNKLLPLLEKNYNPSIKSALVGLAQTSAFDYELLEDIAHKEGKKLGKRIKIERFLRLPVAIQRLVLRQNFACLKGDTRRLNLKHINELEDLINNRPDGSIVDLPAGISVSKAKGFLGFAWRKKA